MANLYKRSIEIIQENQSSTGAYIASPNFKNYAYCWFRDGAYIAYSMDIAGEHQSARRFHDWTADVLSRNANVIERAIENVKAAGNLSGEHYLHARYTLEGEEDHGDWPNYQLDGIGTWLWSLKKHAESTGEKIPDSVLKSAELAVRYLSAVWRFPCSDCWEEYPDQIHTYTLASIYAGIESFSELTGRDNRNGLIQLEQSLFKQGVHQGHFSKFLGTGEIDANLISLATPYGLVKPDHTLMDATITRIENQLYRGGGIRRYPGDTYFGGGEWILLTAWLGWYWTERGKTERAQQLLGWIESRADEKGYLPEQVPYNLNKPEYYEVWRKRWGEIANPLLWSHAMYIILYHALRSSGGAD
jgi:GH15 family glucan-1,4-alpha-glucosidase